MSTEPNVRRMEGMWKLNSLSIDSMNSNTKSSNSYTSKCAYNTSKRNNSVNQLTSSNTMTLTSIGIRSSTLPKTMTSKRYRQPSKDTFKSLRLSENNSRTSICSSIRPQLNYFS
jgi:hypothetical protein